MDESCEINHLHSFSSLNYSLSENLGLTVGSTEGICSLDLISGKFSALKNTSDLVLSVSKLLKNASISA